MSVSMPDILILEERVAHLERIFGTNTSEKEATRVLSEINVKVWITYTYFSEYSRALALVIDTT